MITHAEASLSSNLLELALAWKNTLTPVQFNTLAEMAATVIASDTEDDVARRLARENWTVDLAGKSVNGSRIEAVKLMRNSLGWSLSNCVSFLNGMPEYQPYVDKIDRLQRERLERDSYNDEYLGDD